MKKFFAKHRLAVFVLLILCFLGLRLLDRPVSKKQDMVPKDKAQIEAVLESYVPANSEVKSFIIGDLEIREGFAKAIIKPLEAQTDNAFVILKKESGSWKVIWGPGTSGYSGIEGLPEGL